MCTIEDRDVIYEESYKEGYEAGFKEGYEAGKAEGKEHEEERSIEDF